MIQQAKISQKRTQKAAVKRLISRGLIMTLIELLLITLILSSCEKEECDMRKNIIVTGQSVMVNPDNYTTFEVDFQISRVKRIRILSITPSFIWYLLRPSTGAIGLSINHCLDIPINEIPEVLNYSTGSPNRVIALTDGQKKDVDIIFNPNNAITYRCDIVLTSAPPAGFPNIGLYSLVIEYEEID